MLSMSRVWRYAHTFVHLMSSLWSETELRIGCSELFDKFREQGTNTLLYKYNAYTYASQSRWMLILIMSQSKDICYLVKFKEDEL